MKLKERMYTVSDTNHKERLDIFLSTQMNVSRSKAQRSIQDGLVTVNGKRPKKAGDMLAAEDTVAVQEAQTLKKEKEAKKREERKWDVRVITETKEYVVVEKPSGLLVHPTAARESDTLFSLLSKKYPEIARIGESDMRGGIVHRLDREASGLLVVARTQKMFDALKKQFQERAIEKEYLVLVHGNVPVEQGVLDFAIGRGSDGRMAARPKADLLSVRGVVNRQEGKEAMTEFRIEKKFVRYMLLQVRLHTGRMHQIRVHMLAYNHPVVGDTLYFNKKLNRTVDKKLGRLFLHAIRLCFDDLEGERKCFESALPEELARILKEIV